MDSISKPEMELILSVLTRLPPETLIQSFWTDEQHDHWTQTKAHYRLLLEEMEAYFQGRASQLDHLEAYERECYVALKDVHLALYDLIRYGWRAIQKAVCDYQINFPYEEPGELFSALITNQALARILPCLLGRHDLKPRQVYRLKLKIKKAKGDKKKSDQCQKELDRLLGELKGLEELQKFCIQCCRHAVKQSGDNVLAKKIAEYDRLSDELSKLLSRNYKDSPAVAWEKGIKLYSQKAGGTYARS
jgi:hypothetical protein